MLKADRQSRKRRIRAKISGTADRPRLVVYKSNKYTYAQLVDDVHAKTLAAASDEKVQKGTKVEKARAIGADIAKQALKADIKAAVFDRAGYPYHGRVKAVAEGARAGGLTL